MLQELMENREKEVKKSGPGNFMYCITVVGVCDAIFFFCDAIFCFFQIKSQVHKTS